MTINRRNFLYLIGATTGATVLGIAQKNHPVFAQDEPTPTGSFTLPPLSYDYNALEPYISKETMTFHHDKHHGAFVEKLNKAASEYPELQGQSAEELIANLSSLPQDVQTTVRNNGGGHINHTMYWTIMAANAGGEPTGAIAEVISNNFGSGWVWLVMDKNKKFQVLSTPNQDTPLMQGMYPIMGNDVWEHSYYLTYRNKRDEYLEQWWNVVNWDVVNQRLETAMSM
jgi:superoxide dismutase, Fe-Mn family